MKTPASALLRVSGSLEDMAGGLRGAIELYSVFDARSVQVGDANVPLESDFSALLAYARSALAQLPGVRLIGGGDPALGVVSLVVDSVHAHDVSTVLDRSGIAVRAGHHCAQPVMQHFGVPATVRASFAVYNTRAEIDALVRGLERVRQIFGA